MKRDEGRAARATWARFAFGVVALAAAGGAAAQVTPVEPFGGRPFGSGTGPAPVPAQPQQQQQQQPVQVQPGAAPVLVQPGAGPVVVQPPVQQAAPQPQAAPQQPVQSSSTPGQDGRMARPSSVNPPGPNGVAQPGPSAQSNTRAQQPANNAQDDDGPSSRAAIPPVPSPPPQVTPPFAGNRAPAMGAAPAPAGQPVRGLPPDAPRIVISGAVYSPDRAQRMVIVNGQVFREGADLGSGVVLQEVKPEGAVLDYRGGKYNVFF